MTVLDTQAWVWWTEHQGRLSVSQFAAIVSNEDDVIGGSADRQIRAYPHVETVS